jgi:phosphoadenosine phosphosulfate reductase
MTIAMKSASVLHRRWPRLADAPPSEAELAELNERFADRHPQEILLWAFDNIPRLVIGTSFQLGGLVNIFFSREIVDPVPVLFLETGFHFAETLAFRDLLIREWGIELYETTPTLGPERQAREIHPELYKVDPDQCCPLNKVLPMEAALENFDGWVTGVRRDQGPTRVNTEIFETQELTSGRVIWKVNPQAHWTRAQVSRFVGAHELPQHPLYAKGYLSIGCAPCTRPVANGEDERAGRWDGFGKAECGIHSIGSK